MLFSRWTRRLAAAMAIAMLAITLVPASASAAILKAAITLQTWQDTFGFPAFKTNKKGKIVKRLTFSPRGNLTQAGFDLFVNKQKNIIVFRFNTDVLGTPFTFKTKYRPVGSKVRQDATFTVTGVSPVLQSAKKIGAKATGLTLTVTGLNSTGQTTTTPTAPFVPNEDADSPV
jgi:hypothetical protein